MYLPVDVSSDALDAACDSIGRLLPDVLLRPMVSNYVTHPPKLERFDGTTLAMYIGSSIGNFSPEEARIILRNLRSELRAGDALLLGTDMVKDEATLVRAYDDRDGVTAAFNLKFFIASTGSWVRTSIPGASGIERAGIAWSHAWRCTWRARAISA